jgi:Flp pilus assembly secretin CpaC
MERRDSFMSMRPFAALVAAVWLMVGQPGQVSAQFSTSAKKQDVEVALEVRLVSVAEDCFRQKAKEFGLPTDKADTAFLNENTLGRFLEAIQGDLHTNVMQAPKIITLNGQKAAIATRETHRFVTGLDLRWQSNDVIALPHTEEFPTGFEMALQPHVSSDKRSVLVELDATLSELAADPVPMTPVTTMITARTREGKPAEAVPFTQFLQKPSLNTQRTITMLCVPEGNTAVLCNWKRTREVKKECAVPVLSDIPSVSELFREVGNCCRETRTERVLLMVTPRIVINEEAEHRVQGEGCPFKPQPTVKAAPCPMPVGTVADNLKKLEQARAAFERGEYYRRVGQPGAAKFMYAEACKLCSGSQCAVVAEACLKKMGKEAGGAEEAEVLPCPPVPSDSQKAAELVKAYHELCRAGRPDAAREVAERALKLDPTCFGKGSR